MKSIKQVSLRLYAYKKCFSKLTGIKLKNVDGAEITNIIYKHYSNVNDEKRLDDKKKLLYDKEENDAKELISFFSVLASILFTYLMFTVTFSTNHIEQLSDSATNNKLSIVNEYRSNVKEINLIGFKLNNSNDLSEYEKKELEFIRTQLIDENKEYYEYIQNMDEKIKGIDDTLLQMINSKKDGITTVVLLFILFIFIVFYIIPYYINCRHSFASLCLYIIEDINMQLEKQKEDNEYEVRVTNNIKTDAIAEDLKNIKNFIGIK